MSVELCPAQSKATPNRIGAAEPRKPGNSRCASSMLATFDLASVEDRGADDQDRALTKNATFRARAESIRLYLQAFALLARSLPIRLDCTRAECK